MIFLKCKKETCVEKNLIRLFKMNNKNRILILLKVLDQIQQDNKDARNGIEKSITAIL